MRGASGSGASLSLVPGVNHAIANCGAIAAQLLRIEFVTRGTCGPPVTLLRKHGRAAHATLRIKPLVNRRVRAGNFVTTNPSAHFAWA
jgi:hypothetical protein